MGGIDLKVVTHKLNVDPSFWQIKQKKRRLGVDQNNAVNEEVNRLLENGMIHED